MKAHQDYCARIVFGKTLGASFRARMTYLPRKVTQKSTKTSGLASEVPPFWLYMRAQVNN